MDKYEFPVIYPKSAGIDLGSASHYVTPYPGSCQDPFRVFGCFTCDLAAMALWLKGLGVTHAVMEATGPYWFQVYETLEAHGIHADVVDPRSVSRLPGRKKTDRIDSSELQRMYACGLLSSCFVPSQETLALRTYSRRRKSLVEACSQQVLMLQQSLTLMNVQIHRVLSDLTGLSGMRILRAIVAGERDGKVLASMRDRRVKASEEDIVKSLEGSWAPEHLYCLKQSLAIYDMLCAQLADLDEQVTRELARLSHSQKPAKAISSRRGQPHFEMRGYLKDLTGCDATQLEGIQALTWLGLVSEMGTDLSRFPTDKHFTSFLGLCPNNRITGGKIRSRRSANVTSPTANLFRMAAMSLSRSKSYLGAFFRSVAARRGTPKAITATARKLAERYYMLMTKGGEYAMKTQQDFEDLHAERRLNRLQKAAADLGFTLTALTPKPELSEVVS
jgi:transposase